MSLDRVGLSFILTFLLFASMANAQQAQQPQQPVEPPPPPQTAPSTAQQNVAPRATPPPQEPNILEDGGFSIEPMYWLNRAQPALYGGLQNAQSETYSSQSYPGKANYSYGAELAMPTGHSNTLRFSYFRVLGHANVTESQAVTIFGEAYSAADYVVSSYKIQSFKLSWDYLSYTWRKPRGNIHFKTLYEAQYTTISSNFSAPFVPVTTDSSGNTNYNTSSGSKAVFLPTLGGELEQRIGHGFRWEIKGSGFGLPHHSAIWDAQADIALRISKFELMAGEKAYHFKTSPKADQYFSDTLDGVFVAVRYYIGSLRK
jgi:hypothetical protein